MPRAFRTLHTVATITAVAAAMAAGAAHAQERTVYRCVNASGVVVFSDKECVGNTARLNIKSLSEEELAKRKAERDANNARDANLANQVQANRLATEQAARAAQDQQAQAGKAIADRLEQERTQRNATVVSNPNASQPLPFISP